MFEELEGKEIAIVGLGGSYSDYVKARINSKSYDEVWKDGDRDYWMTSTEAKEYGMIDEVLIR